MSGRARVAGLKVLALASLALAGCKDAKVKDCSTLIEAVNAQEAPVKDALTKAQTSGKPADLDALATALDAAGKEVTAADVADSHLKAYAKDYSSINARFAKDLRDLKTATSSSNQAAATKARAAVDKLDPEKTKLVGQINTYCGR